MTTYEPGDISVGNADWPTYGAAVGFVTVVKYMIAHHMALTAKNFLKAIRLYGTGRSVEFVARQFDVAPTTVRRVLTVAGVTLRRRGRPSR